MGIKDNGPSKKSVWKQGTFPINEAKKFIGPAPIIYRSSWEYKFIIYCERNPEVEKWSSEPLYIPYYVPFDKKLHKYWPDFYIKKKNGTKMLIEIKPKKYTKKPQFPKKKTKKAINNYNKDLREYIRNICKWKAAKEYCEKQGVKFKVLTENFFNNFGI